MSEYQPDTAHPWEQALDDDCSPAARRHLLSCDACLARVLHLRSAATHMHSSIPTASADLDVRVLAKVEAARHAPAEPTSARTRLAAGLASFRRRAQPRSRASNPRPQPRSRASNPRPRSLAITTLRSRPILAGIPIFIAVCVAALIITRPAPLVSNQSQAKAIPVQPLLGHCANTRQLTVAGVWSGQEGSDFARVLGAFEQRTGINVTYEYETHTIATKLQHLINKHCAPDVALLPQPGTMSTLARAGHLIPLDAAVTKLVHTNYSKAWQTLGSSDGKLYGVWFKGAAKSMIWYRPAAFRAAGITHVPRSWSQLITDSLRLRAHGIQPFAIAGADPWTLTDWFSSIFLATAGPVRYQQLADNQIKWTAPSVRHALGLLADIVGNPKISGARSAAELTTFPESVDMVYGRHANTAMVFEGDFVSSFLPRSVPQSQARFFNFPSPGVRKASSIEVGGDVAVILRSSPDAQKMAAFLATPVAGEQWIREGGFISPNRALPLSSYGNELTRRLARRLVDARSVRFGLSDQEPTAFGSDPYQGMWAIFQSFLAHPSHVHSVMRRLERGATAAAACVRAVGGDC